MRIRFSVARSQLCPGEVMVKDTTIGLSTEGQDGRSYLAEPHAMAPTGPHKPKSLGYVLRARFFEDDKSGTVEMCRGENTADFEFFPDREGFHGADDAKPNNPTRGSPLQRHKIENLTQIPSGFLNDGLAKFLL